MLALELNDTHNDLHNYIHDDTRTDTQNDTHNGTCNDTHAGVCWHSGACYTSWWSCPGLATGRHRKRHRSQTVDSVEDLSSTLAESTQLYTVCYWSIGIVKHLDQLEHVLLQQGQRALAERQSTGHVSRGAVLSSYPGHAHAPTMLGGADTASAAVALIDCSACSLHLYTYPLPCIFTPRVYLNPTYWRELNPTCSPAPLQLGNAVHVHCMAGEPKCSARTSNGCLSRQPGLLRSGCQSASGST